VGSPEIILNIDGITSNSYFLQEVLAISYINSDDKILKDA
jgi:hypothetical protein